jgi:hypothetical protein
MVHRWHGRWRSIAVIVVVGALIGVLSAAFRDWVNDDESDRGPVGGHAPAAAPGTAGAPDAALVQALTTMRLATVRYATDLGAAQADGYKVITPMMSEMGVHYLNPAITGFDPAKPPILVYAKKGEATQLVALEWVFPEKPATPPLPGATYGSFDAACHYADGAFLPGAEATCASAHPTTVAPFFFWHPDLVTLHVWLWYPNPAGIFHPTNPLIAPYQ